MMRMIYTFLFASFAPKDIIYTKLNFPKNNNNVNALAVAVAVTVAEAEAKAAAEAVVENCHT